MTATSGNSHSAAGQGCWFHDLPPPVDTAAVERALQRQGRLTKPPGSLGQLEAVAVQLAGLQRCDRPRLEQVSIGIFAADHGVAVEGVSAFPQAVTAEMVRNFAHGGAAISVLARTVDARLSVVNVGTVAALEVLPGVVDRRIRAGSGNIAVEPAMTADECRQALATGRDWVDGQRECQLVIGGEMGIANTTAATALAVALTGLPVVELIGRGTGIDPVVLAHKHQVIERALACHGFSVAAGGQTIAADAAPVDPLDALGRLGGLELAALAGAYIRAAQRGMAILVDGFICTVAALAAVRLNPDVGPWLLFSHCSAEQGHQRLLALLRARPLLALDLRLGEASGAALALPLLRAALAVHNDMATFAEAGVSGGDAGAANSGDSSQ